MHLFDERVYIVNTTSGCKRIEKCYKLSEKDTVKLNIKISAPRKPPRIVNHCELANSFWKSCMAAKTVTTKRLERMNDTLLETAENEK